MTGMNKKTEKTKKNVMLVSLLLALFAGGCGQGKLPAAPYPYPAAADIDVPERIISWTPSNTEIIAGLGLAGRIVAADRWSKQVEGVDSGVSEVDFFYPDAEAILHLEPDIIISHRIGNFDAEDSPCRFLSEMGIRIVQIPSASSIGEICRDIITIAENPGVKSRGEALVKSLRGKIDACAAIGKTIAGKKRAFFAVSPPPDMPSFGSGVYLNELLEIIGVENIFADQQGWFTPNAEAVIERNPDLVFVTGVSGSGEDPAELLRGFAGFETISAIRKNNIHIIDTNSALRSSQNVTLALSQMARAAYPELYEAW
jgi:iron complex transport system substrate-binding protein